MYCVAKRKQQLVKTFRKGIKVFYSHSEAKRRLSQLLMLDARCSTLSVVPKRGAKGTRYKDRTQGYCIISVQRRIDYFGGELTSRVRGFEKREDRSGQCVCVYVFEACTVINLYRYTTVAHIKCTIQTILNVHIAAHVEMLRTIA